MSKQQNKIGMMIQASDKDAIREARAAVVAIMKSSADNFTKREALNVLLVLLKAENIAIQNCHVSVT